MKKMKRTQHHLNVQLIEFEVYVCCLAWAPPNAVPIDFELIGKAALFSSGLPFP